MKNLILVLVMMLAYQVSNAQGPYDPVSFEKNQMEVSVGIGVLPVNVFSTGRLAFQGPSLVFDYGLTDRLSVGIQYNQSEANYTRNILGVPPAKVYNDNKFLGIRVLGHINNYAKWDIYGGALISKNFGTTTIESEDKELAEELVVEEHRKMAYTGLIGTKYRVFEQIAIGGEIGYNGSSLMTVAISFKF